MTEQGWNPEQKIIIGLTSGVPLYDSPRVLHDIYVRRGASLVDEKHRPWREELDNYKPISYESDDLAENSWSAGRGGKWADPSLEDMNGQVKYEWLCEKRPRTHFGDNLTFDLRGRPLNPSGRTGVEGRGELGKWGPNNAVDLVMSRVNENGEFQVLVIRRKDNPNLVALPGGMVDFGETDEQALAREMKEEIGWKGDLSGAGEVYKGVVWDPRNTDNAWIETSAFRLHVDRPVELRAGSDAVSLEWKTINEESFGNKEFYGDHERLIWQAIVGWQRESRLTIAGDGKVYDERGQIQPGMKDLGRWTDEMQAVQIQENGVLKSAMKLAAATYNGFVVQFPNTFVEQQLRGEEGLTVGSKAYGLLQRLAKKSASLFENMDRRVGLNRGELDGEGIGESALAQHCGYVAAVLARESGLDRVGQQRLLDQVYKIMHSSQSQENKADKLNLKEDQRWMVGEFGELQVALNLPGNEAFLETQEFAKSLGFGDEEFKAMYYLEDSEVRDLFEKDALESEVEENAIKLKAVIEFGIRAAQLGYVTTQIGRGLLENNLRRLDFSKALMGTLDDLRVKLRDSGKNPDQIWEEISKDWEQIRSGIWYSLIRSNG